MQPRQNSSFLLLFLYFTSVKFHRLVFINLAVRVYIFLLVISICHSRIFSATSAFGGDLKFEI